MINKTESQDMATKTNDLKQVVRELKKKFKKSKCYKKYSIKISGNGINIKSNNNTISCNIINIIKELTDKDVIAYFDTEYKHLRVLLL